MTKEEREVMRMALERLKEWVDHSDCLEDKQALTAIEKCLANDALEKKAENARELGLDYEPEKTVCPFCSSEWVTAEQHDRKMDRLEYQSTADKSKLEKVPAKGTLLAQPEQKQCDNCGEFGECCQAQPKQELVAWISSEELLVMRGNALGGAKDWRINVGLVKQDGDVGLYTTPPPVASPHKRKPLTDEEIILIVAECASSHQHTDIHFARAIEAAIWEKNK